jgi:hypothetical protein
VATAAPPASAEAFSGLEATSSFWTLDVVGGSMAWGADLNVWWANGARSQLWTYPTSGQTGVIFNANSAMCVTTDDVPGDQLYQFPCLANAPTQQWNAITVPAWFDPGRTMTYFVNPATQLVIDVDGNSYAAGAAVDAWHFNGATNQSWTAPPN